MMGNKFEEYKMKLIWLDKDIICTSGGMNSPGTTDPMPGGGYGGSDEDPDSDLDIH